MTLFYYYFSNRISTNHNIDFIYPFIFIYILNNNFNLRYIIFIKNFIYFTMKTFLRN